MKNAIFDDAKSTNTIIFINDLINKQIKILITVNKQTAIRVLVAI
jgi:hypothetical protein